MKKTLLFIAMLMALSVPAFALSPTTLEQLNDLSKNTAASYRNIASKVYQDGSEADPIVTDALAEFLLRQYSENNAEYSDALAWTAKALANVGNDRYRDSLDEVLKNGKDKRLNKHVKKAYNSINKTDSEQYKKGSIDLDGLLKHAASEYAELHKDNILSKVQIDMSKDEVYELIGKPDETAAHRTGKEYVPFNFKGADLKRQIAVYPGYGYVVFSQKSRFQTTWRVLDVVYETE